MGVCAGVNVRAAVGVREGEKERGHIRESRGVLLRNFVHPLIWICRNESVLYYCCELSKKDTF